MSDPKPSRRNDARTVRSRLALRQALLALIGQKPFEQISIRDITTAAGVSYPVFFRQFSSPQELLADIAADEIHALLSLPFLAPHESALGICRHVHERRPLWTALLTAGAASAMRGEFIRTAKEITGRRGRINPWLPIDLTPAVTVSALFEILAWWLAQPEDYPIERVARYIEVLVIEPVARPQPSES
ncbi:MAG: helix-turn-helix domain-containing protein [Solimonas sp.]